MRWASPMSAASVWGGQVRPTARSFARYASSAGVAVATAALLSTAAPAIMGMANPASQRREGILGRLLGFHGQNNESSQHRAGNPRRDTPTIRPDTGTHG